MRGFVRCDACGRPLTGSWSKGRNGHYGRKMGHLTAVADTVEIAMEKAIGARDILI